MDKIQVEVIQAPSKKPAMAPFLARMTQRGHKLTNMEDLQELINQKATTKHLSSLAEMPHGTIKRFDSYTVAIVGASRRFLAQIRTHQHADFVSGSLQYSDFSANDPAEMFVVPYEVFGNEHLKQYYLDSCKKGFLRYKTIAAEAGNDAAGFVAPNGMRNVLIMQANAQSWQYMIGLRTCRRNSLETRYVLLRIWEELLKANHGKYFFSPSACGCGCQTGKCQEGHMTCGEPLSVDMGPTEILHADFPLLYKE